LKRAYENNGPRTEKKRDSSKRLEPRFKGIWGEKHSLKHKVMNGDAKRKKGEGDAKY